MKELTDDQLHDLTDDELDQRMSDERTQEIDEPEAVEAEGDVDVAEEDSGDDIDVATNDEEEAVEEVDEEDSETPEPTADIPDGEPAEDKGETEEESPDTPTFKDLKVNGKMVPINSIDELYALASGGGHITQQLQGLSSKKKSFAMMDQHNISDSDISMLAEIKSGNKDALATLLKQSGIDTMDVTDEVTDGYRPGQYIPSDESMNLKDVQDEISVDEEYSITQNVVNNMMDERSQQTLVQNPMMIKGLHQDIKSGAYQRVQAEATKLKMMDGGLKSDMDYYIQAAQSGAQQAPKQQFQPEQPAPAKKVNAGKKLSKKAAGSTKSKTPPEGRKKAEDMTDDELMAMRTQIMDR